MTSTHGNAKYTDEHKAYIRDLWLRDLPMSDIAVQFESKFGIPTTKRAIVGLRGRMKLPPREQLGGNWSQEATAKRLATMRANRAAGGPKPKKAATEALAPSEEPLPLGQPGQNPGGCQWIAGDDPKTWVFCGHPKLAGTSYCSHHAQRCLPPKHSAQPPRKHIVMNPDRQFR